MIWKIAELRYIWKKLHILAHFMPLRLSMSSECCLQQQQLLKLTQSLYIQDCLLPRSRTWQNSFGLPEDAAILHYFQSICVYGYHVLDRLCEKTVKIWSIKRTLHLQEAWAQYKGLCFSVHFRANMSPNPGSRTGRYTKNLPIPENMPVYFKKIKRCVLV